MRILFRMLSLSRSLVRQGIWFGIPSRVNGPLPDSHRVTQVPSLPLFARRTIGSWRWKALVDEMSVRAVHGWPALDQQQCCVQ